MGEADPAASIEQHREGERELRVEQRDDLGPRIEQHGHREAVAADESGDRGLPVRTVGADGQDLKAPAAVAVLESLEMGELLDAGDAPGRPEVEQDDLAGADLAQPDGPAREVVQGEVRCFLGQRRWGTEKEDRKRPADDERRILGYVRLASTIDPRRCPEYRPGAGGVKVRPSPSGRSAC